MNMNQAKNGALFLLAGLVLMLTSSHLFAEQDKILRIGGDFRVAKIEQDANGGFIVEFVAKEGKPRFKKLRLESDHIHRGLTEGEVIRLSADVIAAKGDTANVSQVVVFLPGASGPVPVWMLSRTPVHLEPPANLLKMHAPTTDYLVL